MARREKYDEDSIARPNYPTGGRRTWSVSARHSWIGDEMTSAEAYAFIIGTRVMQLHASALASAARREAEEAAALARLT